MPNAVGDDAVNYRCMSCFAEIVFETCGDCGHRQSIPARWHTAFTCGKCGAKCTLPHRRTYSASTRARGVEGYGYTYPRF
jgi:ribosomal protein S27E